MDYPPYTCTGEEEVFSHVEVLDANGDYYNIMISSACFADWYCAINPGFTWRLWQPPVDPKPEEPVQSEPPTNP